MRLVEQDQFKEMPQLAEGWIAQDSTVSPHEKMRKKVGEQKSDSERSPPEVRTLVAQCSILVVNGGIVAGLIAA